MSLPGLGVMIHSLVGGSPKDPHDYSGRTIVRAELCAAPASQDSLLLSFDDGISIRISDNGQSCCEARYMRTDDDLSALAGQNLIAIETRPSPDIVEEEGGDPHEVVFLDVKTEAGVTSFSFHNEHNGYYSGFGLSVDEVAA